MKRFLIFLCALSFVVSAEGIAPLPINKVPLIIQPYYVKDIYGNQILDAVPFRVTVLTFRNFDNDRWGESKDYAVKQSIDTQLAHGKRKVIMLGDALPEVTGRYISVFRDAECACYLFDGKVVADPKQPLVKALNVIESQHVYILSDDSDLAKRRAQALQGTLKGEKVIFKKAVVSSAAELRAQLVEWNDSPRGILYINAFDLIADSGKRIRYRYIEQVITDFNNIHLEVGVYRDAHRSALAVGLDPDTIGKAIMSIVSETPTPKLEVKSSVNVARLSELGLLPASMGSFTEAFLYEPIDSR